MGVQWSSAQRRHRYVDRPRTRIRDRRMAEDPVRRPLVNRRDTIKTIHAVGDAIGTEPVPRAEAREVIAGMSDLPGFDISAFRTETVTGDEVKAELADALGIDRKSTRLNSSHVSISYAV